MLHQIFCIHQQIFYSIENSRNDRNLIKLNQITLQWDIIRLIRHEEAQSKYSTSE